jgi:hypothetical protein
METLQSALAAIGDLGVVGVLIYLIAHHRKLVVLLSKNGGTMHEDKELDFRLRRGAFAGLQDDAPDRWQIMPVPEPPTEEQTHSHGFRDNYGEANS